MIIGHEYETIAAVASAPGVGAIAVVRVSGKDTAKVMGRVFEPALTESHRLYYGRVKDGDEVADEAMAVMMRAPRSYTREDMAEIYCHGGTLTVAAVMNVLCRNGARPAEPGEFTKRAFLNGRIDLSQAEAVMELIGAKTDLARRAVLRRLSGGLSRRIKDARERILAWLAHIEVSIDYPEHEEEAMNLEMVREGAGELVGEIESLLATAKQGSRIKNGVPTVIAGRPNVGKSSLMNAILQEDRAIVTEMAGTTRDTLTEAVTLRNVPIQLTDTAGIREGMDAAEKIGVERSVERAQSAELVLHVVDRSVPLVDEDLRVAEMTGGLQKIIVFNKCDLPVSAGGDAMEALVCGDFPCVEVSAKTGEGLDELARMIEGMFLDGAVSADGDVITQVRHVYLLEGVVGYLRGVLGDIEIGMSEDIVSVGLKAAYVGLGEVIGEEVGDDVLDRVFGEFCLGK